MKTKLSNIPSPYSLKMQDFLLRDLPFDADQPIQSRYMNEVLGFLLRALVKVYGPAELTDKDKADLRRYLDNVIEAKDAIDGKSSGKIYGP